MWGAVASPWVVGIGQGLMIKRKRKSGRMSGMLDI